MGFKRITYVMLAAKKYGPNVIHSSDYSIKIYLQGFGDLSRFL